MFLTVVEGEAETTIKRSRFIAVSRGISSRDDVKRIVADLKREHREARHVCYGFIADDAGKEFGYDDDGEPSGTAGKPIYAALEASGARRSMIAVVRYFGGIKLGVGGLNRAYRESAVKVIEQFGLVRAETMSVYKVRCSGDAYKKILPSLRDLDCKTESIIYNENVEFTAIVPSDLNLDTLKSRGADVEYIGERVQKIAL